MTPANVTHKPKSQAFWAMGLLATILALFFWKCFLPDYVLFSNDGPLGQQMASWRQLPAGFTGCWYDLNDIGSSVGTIAPSIDTLIFWVLGPVGYSKFVTPIALFILGLGAWTFFRQLKLSGLATILGVLAAGFISYFFSDASWGTAPHQIAFGMDFFALALIVSNTRATPLSVRWARLALAGFAVGMNIIEAADIGAIFSLFVAAFALFQSFTEDGTILRRVGYGIGRIAIIATFAAFLAAQTIVALVGANIEGIVGTQQNPQAKAEKWNWATQWSLPKIETLGIVVPGLFGYRMDTPGGGNYWGAIGRDMAWERYIANGDEGSAPKNDPYIRFCGTGNYVGILVILVALWAIIQSLRGQKSIFSRAHREFLWFWTAVLVVSLLFSYGRFAPFYHLFYTLPYFSAIRNPIKFLFVFTWAIVIVFAYGIHGLSRRYLEVSAAGSTSLLGQLKAWWRKAHGFDRNWTSLCIVFFIGSLLAWLIYALQKPNLIAYLQRVNFSDEQVAGQIASFSIHQVGWSILFFALDLALLTLILSGAFAGRRAKWAGILLGILLVSDLGRADLPWIVFWNYPQKYASNPIVDILRNQPYAHRVADLRSDSLFENLYRIEWSQQLFPYYNIQSLDIIQMSRMPEDLAAYYQSFASMGTPGIARRWQLTNTRYLLGPAGYLGELNQQLDPRRHRFGIARRFNILPKPGIAVPSGVSPKRFAYYLPLNKLTAIPAKDGDYALFDFSGALPRAKLYSNWQTGTNDSATLKTITSTDFDAWDDVLVSTPLPTLPGTQATNKNPGTVEFKSYAPTDILFKARAITPSVLLLNDKFDPNWHVFVDGTPKPLLRCNFIMRGVYLTPGEHAVEFKFSLPLGPLYVTLSAIGVGILLCGFLFFSMRRTASK